MASLRNAMPRREHRERSQLASRGKLGLLEKKKDYKLRAKDYHRKQDRLTALKERAAFKNPDEFYFGMIRGKAGEKTQDGVGVRTAEESMLASSRDMSYVYTKAAMDQSRSEKLKCSAHFLDSSKEARSTRQHTIFVEDEEEQREFDATQHFDVPRELLHRSFNRPRTSDMDRYVLQEKGDGSVATAEKEKARDYAEIADRMKRSKRLTKLGLSINMEKHLKGKGAKRKVKARDPWTEEPAVYKWRKQRQR
ncbi:hypothetical protein NDN08_006070 [Rhodosorus marinus]|uniref:U3 small nucleolar RNA-associated protein 11 n=1 Tax=Rhodosorus marinus TaxID=101924 RepID=A0AAV8UJM1_9RHOD|nr:hypothetical protein NDN08_006070 [Rhodosorus marinus]